MKTIQNSSTSIYHNFNLSIAQFRVNTWRTFSTVFSSDKVYNFKLKFDTIKENGTNITLHVFYNFGETIPNVQTHDFLLSVNEDEEASVLVRSSDQFLNDVCRNNDQRLQSNKDTENQNFGEESQRNENNMYFAIIASINFEKQEQETEADYYDLYYDGYNVERHVTRRPWFAHTNYRFIDGFSALAYI
ncbi:uncharacterized protein LOC142349578 isoform X3 [Convolutriloba macropyga]|uniref:uncharacterized protein LOC142349578 isoform X3 n=1 Tax=Convolutriloba macropyga TaxID=536237 RepID=UPI003F5233C7